jgi:hypothetical protein
LSTGASEGTFGTFLTLLLAATGGARRVVVRNGYGRSRRMGDERKSSGEATFGLET